MEGVQDVAPAVKVALKGLAFRCYRPMDEKLLSLARSELQTQSPWEGWVQQLKLEDAQLAAAVSARTRARSCTRPAPQLTSLPPPAPTLSRSRRRKR